jgi:hypothetical protein
VRPGEHAIDVSIERDASGAVVSARIRFGPHHVVEVEREENGRTTFSLVATHHGFRADASEVNGELDRLIEEIRRAHPELAVD